MKKPSLTILRVGLGITFLWIGILILKQPEAWAGYISPWAEKLLPLPVEEAMLGTAILDIVIGALLVLDLVVWLAALLAALHLIIVLVVSGITDITVRDIAILAAAIALMADSLPKKFITKIMSWQKQEKPKNNNS